MESIARASNGSRFTIGVDEKPTCIGPECDRSSYGELPVCDGHRQQQRAHPDRPLSPLATRRRRGQPKGECIGPECGKLAYSTRGHCAAHAEQLRRNPSQPLRPLIRRYTALDGHRECAKCHATLPLSDFRAKSTGHMGLTARCGECLKQDIRAWSAANADWARLRQRASRFGISPDALTSLAAIQAHKCAICGTHQDVLSRALAVDHNHACCSEPGRSCGDCIRGLLCHVCNPTLGHYESGWSVTIPAFDAYLANPPARQLREFENAS
jgi:hypothetical protein